jgi:threonine synthase
MRVTIFVPHDSPAMKRRQIEAYGARVVPVTGGREAVAAACMEAGKETFYAGHAWNPHFLTGPRTLAWELVEQCGGQGPAAVCVPVGQGGLLLGLAHGFADLVAAGSLEVAPRLVGVQSAAYAPVVAGLRQLAARSGAMAGAQPASPPAGAWNATPPPVRGGATLADAIRTPKPVRYGEVLAALAAGGGLAVAVEDDAIIRAARALGRAGLYAEPTSAAAAAGALQALGDGSLADDGPVVVVLTGHGLKSAALPAAGGAPHA